MASSPAGPERAVLIVEPMGGALALIAAARTRGFQVVVATFDDDDRCLDPAVRDQVDGFLVVDTNDEPALTEKVLAWHARQPFDAVLPGFEFYVDVVARLAARLGVPGLPPESVTGLRDKAVMRSRVRAASLRTPRYAEATDRAELVDAAREVGFPAVLKPAASAGSVHVSRVDDLPQLLAAYAWMSADDRTDLGRALDGRVLLEEYISGPEVSVEGYVHGERVTVVSITTKLLGPEPFFVEVGHIVQRDMPPAERADVESYVSAVCQALGLTMGTFHCELRLSAAGPVLIEIGARLPGGHIAELIELATGVSLPQVMLAAYVGDPDLPYPAGTPRVKHAGLHNFTAPELTRLTAVLGLDELRAAPDVLALHMFVSPGDELPRPDDFRSRLGFVMFGADSYAAALQRRAEIEGQVRFV